MRHENWICQKCQHAEYEVGEIRVTGSFWTKILNVQNKKDMPNNQRKIGLTWESWSPEKMLQYKNSKDLVFIDFTADWCLTCKANEKLILDTDDFKNLVKKSKNWKLLLNKVKLYAHKKHNFNNK